MVKKCQFSCNASSTYSGDYTTPASEEEEVSETPEYYDNGGPIEAEPLVRLYLFLSNTVFLAMLFCIGVQQSSATRGQINFHSTPAHVLQERQRT